MKDLAPAFRRLASIEDQRANLFRRERVERQRIRKEGIRVARIAMRRAGFVEGKTLIGDRRGWEIGLYRGINVLWGPLHLDAEWHFEVHWRSVLKTGKPGRATGYRGIHVDHPSNLPDQLTILGTIGKSQ